MNSPDNNSTGLLAQAPGSLRYENSSRDPDDVGMKLASLIAKGSLVLDVGCGTGSVTDIIRQETGAEVIGIEPDTTRANAARERGIIVFDCVLSEALLRDQGPFDTILFADVLEHLSNPAEIVLLAKSGLKPGGAIIASVPNVAHWFVRIDLLRGRFRYQQSGIMDATHLRWFTRDTLHDFLSNLGLRITDHQYTVNTAMPEYQGAFPWRLLPPSARMWLVRRLVGLFPTLFGCQHVVRAVSVESPKVGAHSSGG